MKIAILGFGKEGKSALRFLKKQVVHKKTEFWILDENPATKAPRGVRVQLGKNWLRGLSRFDLVVRSPGIYYNRKEFKAARRRGVKFTSPTKIFFDHCPANIIGITGSKGKSTTATLLYKILKRAGFPAYLAGNIGAPALDILPRLTKKSWVVLELSSFQLQDLKKSPHIAVITDMFPEHQDIHDTIEDYYRAKTSICKHQTTRDMVFYLDGNVITKHIAKGGRGRKIPVSEKTFPLFALEDLKLNGSHQYRNAALAASVALRLGAPSSLVKKVAAEFPGLPHRLEFVRRIRGHRGSKRGLSRKESGALSRGSASSCRESALVEFYNDSQSTNAYSVIAAAKSFPNRNVIIIGGGYDKNVDYAPFKQSLKKTSLKLVVLFGQNRYKIQKGFRAAGVPTKIVKDLKSAVFVAYGATRKHPTSHIPHPTSIILSPGTSSFDMFKNYAERGEAFKKIVKALGR